MIVNVSLVTKILEKAECKEIEGFRCFVVPWGDFQDIFERLEGPVFTQDVLTRKHEMENFELRLSSLEEGKYYVCAKSEPVLDELWKKKFKGNK
jgi:hypothetical protein